MKVRVNTLKVPKGFNPEALFAIAAYVKGKAITCACRTLQHGWLHCTIGGGTESDLTVLLAKGYQIEVAN